MFIVYSSCKGINKIAIFMYVDLSELSDGFSSKFRVISFFLAIIKLNKLKKKLYIYEKKTKECPYLFTDLCLIKNFKIIKLKKKPIYSVIFNPYNYNTALQKLKKKNFINYKKNNKFNQIANLVYKSFIPSKVIQKNIDKLNLPANFISIHIRSTDREVSIKNCLSKIQFQEMIFDFQIENMIKNLNNFIKSKSKINNVFISSDNKYYKEKIIKKLKDKINIFSNNSSYRIKSFRQTTGKDFITELFCLSKSKIIISTLGGAVPNSACLISKKKIKLYKWSNIFDFYIFFKILIIFIYFLKRIKSLLFNKRFISIFI
jgi:hypothetical protein